MVLKPKPVKKRAVDILTIFSEKTMVWFKGKTKTEEKQDRWCNICR